MIGLHNSITRSVTYNSVLISFRCYAVQHRRYGYAYLTVVMRYCCQCGTSYCDLSTSYCDLSTSYCDLSTSYCDLSTSYCDLSTSYCDLSTSYCDLSTSYCDPMLHLGCRACFRFVMLPLAYWLLVLYI